MERLPLAVIEFCDENANITPMYVVKDGRKFEIEKILCVSRHAPPVECVMPTRYDCIIDGVKKTVYRDAHPSNKWFSVRR